MENQSLCGVMRKPIWGREGFTWEKSISKVSELQEGKKGVYTDKLACGVQSQIRRERCLSGEEVAVDMQYSLLTEG